jgi:hypothetical protein
VLWSPGPPSHPDYYRITAGGPLMPKSYVPRLLQLMKVLSLYITKHQDTLFKFVHDPTHQPAISNFAPDLQHCLSLFNRPPEQP